MGLNQLSEVGVEQLIGHPKPAARVEHFHGKEEAVGAVVVADGAPWLGEQVNAGGAALRVGGRE